MGLGCECGQAGARPSPALSSASSSVFTPLWNTLSVPRRAQGGGGRGHTSGFIRTGQLGGMSSALALQCVDMCRGHISGSLRARIALSLIFPTASMACDYSNRWG
jgi:hypothetical protein